MAPITKKIISNLKNLKLIITSGMRNKSIDFLTAKEKKILVCGTLKIKNGIKISHQNK